MILTCPSCGTQYAVKDGAIPEGGRKVRCAACGHSWHQEPEASASEDAVKAPQLEPQGEPSDFAEPPVPVPEPAPEPARTRETACGTKS